MSDRKWTRGRERDRPIMGETPGQAPEVPAPALKDARDKPLGRGGGGGGSGPGLAQAGGGGSRRDTSLYWLTRQDSAQSTRSPSPEDPASLPPAAAQAEEGAFPSS